MHHLCLILIHFIQDACIHVFGKLYILIHMRGD
jgi:hypothetical protein